jgi:K+-sensing histidine kinase KdpD
MNLGRNATKFVDNGFVRFRGAVVDGLVELYVEDSGPGIPAEKRGSLFEKFQVSLDNLSQGTGVGLCLCQNLAELLGGSISLDDSYKSGIAGSPGARFIIRLNKEPIPNVDDTLPSSKSGTGGSDQGSDEIETNKLPEVISVLLVDDDRILRTLFKKH